MTEGGLPFLRDSELACEIPTDGHDLGRLADQHSPMPGAESPVLRGFLAIGAPGFEPGTSCPPDKRANQAAPRPVGPGV